MEKKSLGTPSAASTGISPESTRWALPTMRPSAVLAEDAGEPHAGHGATSEQLGEPVAGTDRGQRVGVANEHYARLLGDRQ